jgi:hypothetical protein
VADEAFSIDKRPLRDLLQQVEVGKAQLPEFQRGWVWPYPNIVLSLAELSRWHRDATQGRWRRPVQVPAHRRGLADGKARAGLAHTRRSAATDVAVSVVESKASGGHPGLAQAAGVRLYVDMLQALDENADREDAIRFVHESRKVLNFRGQVVEDYSTPEREYGAYLFPLFPLHAIFDGGDWGYEFTDHWDGDRDKRKPWRDFNEAFVRPFDRYHIPVIELGPSTPRQAVCQVFEKVNTGGVTLTVFELLTATYAADEFDFCAPTTSRCSSLLAGQYHLVKSLALRCPHFHNDMPEGSVDDFLMHSRVSV